MKLKKINDNIWEVEKTGDMNVPVRIFASEKLLNKMQNDHSIQQGINVASCLPGIYSQSIMLPDAHSGYGFSIGGVAAIDAEHGCITPGGIGFDINCLTGDSEILTEYGYYKQIRFFENDFVDVETSNSSYVLKSKKSKITVVSLDLEQKSFSSKDAAYFMKKKHFGKILEFKTNLGYSLKATSEHPILTKNGMQNSAQIKHRQEIAIYPFKGVHFEQPNDEELVSEEVFSKEQKAELKKRGLLPFNLNNEKLPIITKLFGYLIGDGAIYMSEKKGFVNAYGQKEDLELIQKDFETLGFSGRIYSRKRDHKIPTRYGQVEFTSENFELHVSSTSLAKLFFELGYPEGNKTITQYLIPEWIMQSPLWIKRLFLSAFFGAEMSAPSTLSKTCFYCPTVSINKNAVHLENVREYAIQIMTLLEEFGIKTHELHVREDFINKNGKTSRLKILVSSEEENLIRLYEKIGFSYNKKRDLLSQIAILYTKEKMLLTQKRVEIAKKVKEYKKVGLTLKEVQKKLTSNITNKRFIERHYYENVGNRITLTFPSFKEYSENKLIELEKYGCLFDKVESITVENFDDFVYDFNIPKTHNFIANGIIVSNCGVRLLTTNLSKDDVEPKIRELLNSLFKNVPSGVGSESKTKLSDKDLDDVLNFGAKWALEKGYGEKQDLDHCEEEGYMKTADASKVTVKAKARGKPQLGTLGAGNHFLEVQIVDKIFDKKAAKIFGIKNEGQIVVMIHCGSRGLGHQVCSDYLRQMEEAYPDIMKTLPEKDLIYAPSKSKLAEDYFKAMSASANYAWANRHIIAHFVRQSFKEVFGDKVTLDTVYDVSHNMAKLEEHEIDGVVKKVFVHRKGATRAFGPGRIEIPKDYQEIGQPIIIPGSMGTSSYVLLGTSKAMSETFGSTAHGAGRAMSRHEAINSFKGETIKNELEKRHIYVKAASWKGIAEEAPLAYKDIDEVVKVSHEVGIGTLVVKVIPLGVIKG